MFDILIKSPDGLSSELHRVSIEETFETKRDGRGGCLFRTLTGKSFFLPFERFSIWGKKC